VVVWVVGDATVKGSETGTSFRQALYFKEIGFNLHDTMIWQKNASPRDTRIPRYWQGFEYMFIFSKGKPSTLNFIREPCKTFGKKKRSYMRNPDGTMREDRKAKETITKIDKPKDNVWFYGVASNPLHPAPFPEQLANDHIISWSNE
jgi:site-specific DNA-methyltransferase (adenine-specific)